MKTLVFAAAALWTVVLLIPQQGEVDPSGPMGGGMPDDPNNLREWQLSRLRDPATGALPADIRRRELAFAATLPQDLEKSLTWIWQGPRDRGGRTRALEVDITNNQIWLAGGVTGGVWRTTDAGSTWARTSPLDAMCGVSAIGQDVRAGHEQTWYFGTGENYGVVSGTSFSALLPGDGMFKSTDGGQSWAHLPSTIAGDHETYNRSGSFKQVNAIVVDPVRNDSDIVLAAVYGGIFRSNDGGGSWHAVLGLDTAAATQSLYTYLRVSPTGVFYAYLGNQSAQEGMWRSTDGLNWTNITPNGLSANKERFVLALDPSDENTMYWFGETPSSGLQGHSFWKYTYLSGDGTGAGGQWLNRTLSLPNGSCTGYFTFDFAPINTQTSYDMCIAVHPTQPNTVFIGGTNIYRSTNAFFSPDSTKWIGGYRCNTVDPKDYVYPGHHPDQHWMTFLPGSPDVMLSASDGGISRTDNCLADSVLWYERNDGYITSQFYTVHMEEGQATNDLILGGTQDNGCYMAISADPAVNFARVHQDDGAYCAIPAGHPFILTSSQSGRIYKKQVDAQGNILAFERIDPVGGTSSYNFINAFVLDPVDNDVLYMLSASRIWRNNGLAAIPYTNEWYDKDTMNWENLTASYIVSQRITCLDISLAAHSTVLYGTTGGRVYRLDSLDTANPVRTERSDSLWPNAYVSCVAPNDFDADEWILTFSNYGVKSVWHTTDGGTTWESISGNLEENADGTGSGPAVFWAMIYPTWNGENDQYFVATSTGLYSTALLDGDNTVWEQEGPGNIGNVPVNMITARGSDGRIAVGTHANGVYTSFLPAAPVSVTSPEGAGLSAPFPNPAQEEVRFLLYATGSQRAVKVRVFDLNGRVVLERSIASPSAGNLTWRWDLRSDAGHRVAQGTYAVAFEGLGTRPMVRKVVVH
ncbi:MAG: hypothetical protein IPO12_17465 [Flavobacteriales bacterium]|nr:hypothetical protein [Flavobacteriales bacterium]